MENINFIESSCIEFLNNPFAANVEWKDVTQYSRDQNRIPQSFCTTISGMDIILMRGHVRYKGEWCFTCRGLGFEAIRIAGGNTPANIAAEKAFNYCKRRIQFLYLAFATVSLNK